MDNKAEEELIKRWKEEAAKQLEEATEKDSRPKKRTRKAIEPASTTLDIVEELEREGLAMIPRRRRPSTYSTQLTMANVER